MGDSTGNWKIDNARAGHRAACYQNLQLIKTLDKNLFSAFLAKRRGAIEQSKKIVEEGIEESKRSFIGYWEKPNSGGNVFERDYIRNLKSL